MHTNGDLLAALRGLQELCIEVAEDPDGVAAACEHLTNFYQILYGGIDLIRKLGSLVLQIC